MAPPTCESRKIERLSMTLENKSPAHRSWSAVEILIGTPDREIGAPVVQRQRHVADRVGEVESDDGTREDIRY